MINMPRKNHISPSLGAIISQSYVDNRCPSHEFTEDLKSAAKADAVDDGNVQADGNWSVDLETATYSYDKKTRFVDDSFSFEETTALRQHQVHSLFHVIRPSKELLDNKSNIHENGTFLKMFPKFIAFAVHSIERNIENAVNRL